MSNAAAAIVAEEVLEVPVGDVLPSTIPNYRRSINEAKLRELADSMLQVGVLEPIVLRPQGNAGLELVFGERRLRAAKLAGLPTIKAIVRDYDDNLVRESRLVENLEREDVDPLEEAAAFQELVALGYSAPAIAEKLGQPGSYVAQRLQLNTLAPACRKALDQGNITIGVAVLLAALPSVKLQEQGLEHVLPDYDGRIATVADARREIEDLVMMKLADAPFRTDDASLVPEAGACTNCPKRTGAQALLFADASDPDLCIDRVCYRRKQDAGWKLKAKEAKAEGINVLGAKEGEEAIRRLMYGDSKFVRLDGDHWDGKKHVKVAKLLGKKPQELTLARDTKSGLVIELVPKSVFDAAAKKKTKAEPEERSTPDAKAKAEREAERIKAEVNRRAMTAIVEAADAATRKGKPSRALLRLAIRGALDSVWTDVTKKVADRRGLPLTDEARGTTKKGAKRQLERLTPAVRIERLLDTLDEGGLFALLLELAMGRSVPGKWSEGSDCYAELCTELGVNPKGIEVTVKAERKEKAKAKAKPAPPRPEHPATGQVVHFIDPAGLSKTGAACGGKVGTSSGKGTLSDEPEKVTCKSCRRVAGLEATK
jgi:ParB/RepB/Spo0J family partition protein